MLQELIKITKNISYILQFMIVQDLWQAHYQIFLIIYLKEIIELKRKYGHNDKKCETCGFKYKYCDCFLEYTNFANLKMI